MHTFVQSQLTKITEEGYKNVKNSLFGMFLAWFGLGRMQLDIFNHQNDIWTHGWPVGQPKWVKMDPKWANFWKLDFSQILSPKLGPNEPRWHNLGKKFFFTPLVAMGWGPKWFQGSQGPKFGHIWNIQLFTDFITKVGS